MGDVSGEPRGPALGAGTAFESLRPGDPREVGRYLLHSRIGAGGMGAVYLSYSPGGRPVAVKVIRPEFAAVGGFRRRFAEEVANAQLVKGRFTAEVIDFDAQAELPWLATVYVNAPSLDDVIARHGPLPPQTVLLLIAGVAEALQSIHSVGVVHRDLTPRNILVAEDGPRVIDFGLSRSIGDSGRTASQSTSGSPPFMAPEQATGKHLSPAVDIFSLGSTAYFAATGEKPFGGGHLVGQRIISDEPDWDRCPEQLRGILRSCLRKNHEARPTAADLIGLCHEASTDLWLRSADGWLPPTVVAAVTRPALAPPVPLVPPVPPRKRWRLPSGGTWLAGVRRHRWAGWLAAGLSAAALAAVMALLLTVNRDGNGAASGRLAAGDPAQGQAVAPGATSPGTAPPTSLASSSASGAPVPSPVPPAVTPAPGVPAPTPRAGSPVVKKDLRIAAAGDTVYALDRATGVYRYSGSGGTWIPIGGPRGELYGGGYGLFATDGDGFIHRYQAASNSWQLIGTPGAAFAVTAHGLYGLTPDRSSVQMYTGSGDDWIPVGGRAEMIYGGGYGLFAINPDTREIWRYRESSPRGWERVGTPGAVFAVTNDRLYGLSEARNTIHRYSGSGALWATVGEGSWETLYGGGYGLFATDRTSGDIYRYLVEPNSWQRIGTPGAMFAVTTSGIYGLAPGRDQVHRYTGSGNVWSPVGAPR